MEDPVAISRRSLVKAGFGAMGAATLAPLASCASLTPAQSTPVSETLVAALYKNLSADQRQVLCRPFSAIDDPSAARGIPKIGAALSADQQEMVRQIFIGLHSPDYADKVMAQVVEDNGPFSNTFVSFFGEPGTGRFEFVHSVNHYLRRCGDGLAKGTAFGRFMWYGHDAGGHGNELEGHPGDAYFFQARQASQVFKMLDGKQQMLALVDKDPGEGPNALKLSGKTTGLPGIPMTELSRDQKDEVRKTLETALAPFRKADADEAMKMIEVNGFDNLHIAFYKSGRLDGGNVWNIWRIEGPAMYAYFHGVPHVHAYIRIRPSADV